jgi:hypothetical protein
LKKFVTKYAKPTVSFCLKNNETCETACFASKRNFAKQQVCFAKHETCFVSCFAEYETKLVSLETLVSQTFSGMGAWWWYCPGFIDNKVKRYLWSGEFSNILSVLYTINLCIKLSSNGVIFKEIPKKYCIEKAETYMKLRTVLIYVELNFL